MKIDATTRLWCVTDPTPRSTLPDICFATTLDGLRLQFAGGLTMGQWLSLPMAAAGVLMLLWAYRRGGKPRPAE